MTSKYLYIAGRERERELEWKTNNEQEDTQREWIIDLLQVKSSRSYR